MRGAKKLITRIHKGDQSPALSKAIAKLLYGDTRRTRSVALALGGDLHAAIAIFEEVLPGWVYKVCRCYLSDDAWAVPDFNDPEHSERLFAIVGEIKLRSTWDVGFDVDLRPPRGAYPGAALLIVTILGYAALVEISNLKSAG